MSDTEIIAPPLLKPAIKIHKQPQTKLGFKVQEESQVTIKCSYTSHKYVNAIRVWKTTFLYPKNSSNRSKLIHSEGISLFPVWTQLRIRQTINFTLIFSALPKDCSHFDLIELTDNSNGFSALNIARNNTDVYFIDFS